MHVKTLDSALTPAHEPDGCTGRARAYLVYCDPTKPSNRVTNIRLRRGRSRERWRDEIDGGAPEREEVTRCLRALPVNQTIPLLESRLRIRHFNAPRRPASRATAPLALAQSRRCIVIGCDARARRHALDAQVSAWVESAIGEFRDNGKNELAH
ncbi:hypothetical protein EVAR_33326_1 [Eumeta japonica]|uniref:Uncharacterized protein n=1 Tax=Eumeta variegata TaxID=151549 RepID=A0A4C1WGR0_EUMVA|nr:hypothetical protein EVAR_33326_1 [Eumeta japonica]